jgi:hypothetical protein
MAVIHEKLFRFISRLEFVPSADPTDTLPVAVHSFPDISEEFDRDTNTFKSPSNCLNGIPFGLSLRKYPPGHPSMAITIVHDIPPPQDWRGDVVYFIKSESILAGSRMEDIANAAKRLTPSAYRGLFGCMWPDPAHPEETVSELCYFRCYELAAGTELPEGLAYMVDNVPSRATSPCTLNSR